MKRGERGIEELLGKEVLKTKTASVYDGPRHDSINTYSLYTTMGEMLINSFSHKCQLSQ